MVWNASLQDRRQQNLETAALSQAQPELYQGLAVCLKQAFV